MGTEETVRALKKSQRLEILEKRRKIPPADRNRRSGDIWLSLSRLPAFTGAALIASYIGYGEEVATADGLKGLLRQGRRIAVPSMPASGGDPFFSELQSWQELAANSFGILEPRREHLRPVASDTIPFFVIPGVAFDLRGHRLGYGLGFFDRALTGVGTDALLVALAFEEQIVDHVPVISHDLPVDVIVTEKRVVQTSARSRSIEEVC